jgi:hypothetical protein
METRRTWHMPHARVTPPPSPYFPVPSRARAFQVQSRTHIALYKQQTLHTLYTLPQAHTHTAHAAHPAHTANTAHTRTTQRTHRRYSAHRTCACMSCRVAPTCGSLAFGPVTTTLGVAAADRGSVPSFFNNTMAARRRAVQTPQQSRQQRRHDNPLRPKSWQRAQTWEGCSTRRGPAGVRTLVPGNVAGPSHASVHCRAASRASCRCAGLPTTLMFSPEYLPRTHTHTCTRTRTRGREVAPPAHDGRAAVLAAHFTQGNARGRVLRIVQRRRPTQRRKRKGAGGQEGRRVGVIQRTVRRRAGRTCPAGTGPTAGVPRRCQRPLP